MQVRVFQKAKSAMQSGGAGWDKPPRWTLEPYRQQRAHIDPLTGWQSSADTLKTIHLEFESLDDALAYCKAQGLKPIISTPPSRRRRIKAYADNFAFGRRESWTH